MHLDAWPTTLDLLDAFTEEVAAAGGAVTDAHRDDARLYVRSVVRGAEADVRAGDTVRGGVAMRAAAGVVSVHPYTYRLVCRNGAVHAQTTGTCTIRLDEEPGATADGILYLARQAVRFCAAPDAFAGVVDDLRRSAAEVSADIMVNMMSMLRIVPPATAALILRQFDHDGDRSRFGAMNAITATARDTRRDPELRWRLEELGGGVAARAIAPRAPRPPLKSARRADEALVPS